MPNPAGQTYAYIGLFPLDPAQDCAKLRTLLRGYETLELGSPFAAVGRIHMARLAILDETFYQGVPSKPDVLASRYLLFACQFDGKKVAELVERLATAMPEVAEIWGYCLDVPLRNEPAEASEELTKYFLTCQLKPEFFANLQQDSTVEEILRALQLKREFAAKAKVFQSLPPAQLQAEFIAWWRDANASAPPKPGSI